MKLAHFLPADSPDFGGALTSRLSFAWGIGFRTFLIDSPQLEFGEVLSNDFRKVAAREIESIDELTDADLLREMMNTIGRPCAYIRRIISGSMLTKGWDANTVTHIMGVRVFCASPPSAVRRPRPPNGLLRQASKITRLSRVAYHIHIGIAHIFNMRVARPDDRLGAGPASFQDMTGSSEHVRIV